MPQPILVLVLLAVSGAMFGCQTTSVVSEQERPAEFAVYMPNVSGVSIGESTAIARVMHQRFLSNYTIASELPGRTSNEKTPPRLIFLRSGGASDKTRDFLKVVESAGEASTDISRVSPRVEDVSYAGLHILWIRAKRFSSKYLASSMLLIPKVKDSNVNEFQTWVINVSDAQFGVDIPARLLDFQISSFSKTAVAQFGFQNILTIYKDWSFTDVEGLFNLDKHDVSLSLTGEPLLTRAHIALPVTAQFSEGSLESGNVYRSRVRGILKLPRVFLEQRELMKVVAGVMLCQANRWLEASAYLEPAIRSSYWSSSVKYALLLFLAFAKERSGEQARDLIEEAIRLLPHRATAYRYMLMSRVAEYKRLSSLELNIDRSRKEHIATIVQLRETYQREIGDTPWSENFDSNLSKLVEKANAK